jgi:glycosyltransferase involved in cell wall biosynthesis
VPLVNRRATKILQAVAKVHQACADFDPDVLVAHNIGATLTAASARSSSRTQAPLVSIFHGVAAVDYARAARILDRCSDHVVAVSETLESRLVAAGLRRPRLQTIANAVSPPVLPSRHHARQALGLTNSEGVVVCIARLAPQKRHDVLLRAWGRVPGDTTLLLAGDGPLRKHLQAMTIELDIAHRVRFLGVRDDVPRLLAAADVSTLSSDWEGLPLAVLESMAAGLPVVATSVDGLRETVHADEGILVPAGEPGALATALRLLLEDDNIRRQMGDSARSNVLRRHDPDNMVRRYDALFTSAVSTAQAHSRLSPSRRFRRST